MNDTIFMTYIILLLGLIIASAISAAMVPPLRRLAVARGWVDHPDGQRKLHKEAVPSVGGIAIVAGFVGGGAFLLLAEPLLNLEITLPSAGLWLGALLMFATGFYDDTRAINFKLKLLLQVLAAYMLLHAGFRIDLSAVPFLELNVYTEALYSIPLTLLWVVGIINAVNLIDGLDGLAGGVLIIAFATLAAIFGMQGEIVLVLLAVPVIGALLGFLIHNFNPASVFMGDSGSLVLGYMVAAYSLQAPVHADPFIAILVPAVALGVPLVDTGLSVLRRFLERKAVCAPDHDHVHHRLTRRWPVRRSVLILYGASLWFAAAAFVMSQMMAFQGMMVLALTAVASIMGLRALGYLHIRESLDVWRAVRIEAQIEESDAEIPSSRRVSKLHPLLIQRVEDDQAHYERRPKVNIRDDSSSGDSQASAA